MEDIYLEYGVLYVRCTYKVENYLRYPDAFVSNSGDMTLVKWYEILFDLRWK